MGIWSVPALSEPDWVVLLTLHTTVSLSSIAPCSLIVGNIIEAWLVRRV